MSALDNFSVSPPIVTPIDSIYFYISDPPATLNRLDTQGGQFKKGMQTKFFLPYPGCHKV